MHEVSLMKGLLDIVAETARREKASKVDLIHLRIGEMAGVNFESLRFAFDILSKGTPADGGSLEYEEVPLRGRCRECSKEFHPERLVFRCPSCGGASVEIVSGREMEVDYILLGEDGDGSGDS